MNRFVRLVRENLLPSIIFAILVLSCGSAWYLLHPSSPHHKRYSFVVRYDAIGTLSPGNRVEVRGISAGEITKVELTEDAVYVTARVYASTRIPTNSEFRLINSGLMGEREMCVLTGDGNELVHDGDTLNGHYDEGTSGVGLKLYGMLNDISAIKDTLKTFMDSLENGDMGKRTSRVVKKGKQVISTAKNDIDSWKGDVLHLIDDLDKDLSKVKSALDEVVEKGGPKVDEAKEMLARVNGLLDRVNELKDRGVKILSKADGDNTVGLARNTDGALSNSVERLSVDIDALISDIRKSGLKLNVDIF